MSSATVTSKGQITIPHDVRTAMGIVAGDKLEFVRMDDGHFAVVAATGSVRSLEGLIPRPKRAATLEEMQQAIEDGAAGK